ncbi:hypothetical protein AB0F91_34670 [Amycolatopsis sp. NPDC023774]|uniref:hypothetical protein n=1 Tax=Amycolatopsis sp. NPDC023774 TaxID=3155015 RepID=UPI0034116B87
MFTRYALLTATVVTVFGLTACGTNAPPTTRSFPHAPAPVSATDTAAAAPASGAPTNLAKKIGRPARHDQPAETDLA